MAELDKFLPSQKVRHVGIFDFKEVYRICYEWFINEGYDVAEKNYTEKIQQRGKEIEIEWLALRKVSDYFRFQIKSRWHILGMNDVEVEENGRRLKMNQGDLEIRFTVILEKDYKHRWESNKFFKTLRKVYDKYVLKARILKYEEKLFAELNDLVSQVKAKLALSTTK